MGGKITNIKFNDEKERVYIFIDGEYCTSIRQRTWSAFNLSINDEINCEELKKKEKLYLEESL